MKEEDFLRLPDYERKVAMTWRKVFFGHEFYYVSDEILDEAMPLIEEDWKTDFVSKLMA